MIIELFRDVYKEKTTNVFNYRKMCIN